MARAKPKRTKETRSEVRTVGIDVGGARKGFHAVAMTNGQYSAQLASTDAQEIVGWCLEEIKPRAIAVDAPCRWSADGRARPAERQLMDLGIWCFSTPSRITAINHRTNHYGWMLRGEALYQALEPEYRLLQTLPAPTRRRFCLETYPHAITWHLGGRKANARLKRQQRRALLRRLGVNLKELTNIDLIDAALCSWTAHVVAADQPCRSYGEPETGLIVVPLP